MALGESVGAPDTLCASTPPPTKAPIREGRGECGKRKAQEVSPSNCSFGSWGAAGSL